MSLFVVVYGTLRAGMSNHFYMEGAVFKEVSTVTGFKMFKNPEDPYPYVKVGNGQVVVELYEITQQILENLDVLEEYPRLYTRQLIEIKNVFAWIYVFTEENRLDAIEITSGDWVEYVNKGLIFT